MRILNTSFMYVYLMTRVKLRHVERFLLINFIIAADYTYYGYYKAFPKTLSDKMIKLLNMIETTHIQSVRAELHMMIKLSDTTDYFSNIRESLRDVKRIVVNVDRQSFTREDMYLMQIYSREMSRAMQTMQMVLNIKEAVSEC